MAVNSTTGFSPRELWYESKDMRKLAKERADNMREIISKKKRIFPVNFYAGQMVLIREHNLDKQRKFDRKWKGPYKLIEKISNTMWSAKKFNRGNIVILHEDQIQPFDL